MELYVSRHGETVSNIEQRLTGKDLEETGKQIFQLLLDERTME